MFCRQNNIHGKPGMSNKKKFGATPRQAFSLYSTKISVRSAFSKTGKTPNTENFLSLVDM
jgi:hypothetical protein